MTKSLSALFSRDLEKLREELSQYQSEQQIWVIDGDIKNSAGTLCLHICGNLQHFIGAILGNTGYVRDRKAEFSNQNVPLQVLLEQIDRTIEVVNRSLSAIDSSKLQETYPISLQEQTFSVDGFLMHLYGHLNWHLGQVNYHRRLMIT